MRRKFKKIRYVEYEYKLIKNPHYNEQEKVHYERQGMYYPVEEYIEKEIPQNKYKESSHIEYKIKCAYCGGVGWVKRRDAKFCCGNCRKLNYRDNQKTKE